MVAALSTDFRPQWNSFTCGPAALRCALLMYGDKVDGKMLAKLAGTTYDGTDDWQIDRAARELGFRLRHRMHRYPAEAYADLLATLRDRTPVLLCVDNYGHWITAVRATTRHVWICEVADVDVLRRVTWRQLFRRLQYGLPDELRYDLYPLVLT